MSEMRQITVDGDTADAIADAIEAGGFSGEAEVVAEAIAVWRETRIAELRALVDQALAADDWVDGNFDAADVKRRGRERLGLPH